MKDKKQKKTKKDVSDRECTLMDFLSWGLLTFPQFLTDFPAIVVSLDAGEYINVDNISDLKLRTFLNEVMYNLPVQLHKSEGWYKKDINTSVSGFVLKYMLDKKAIRQPTELSVDQQLSSQNAPLLIVSLIKEFPALVSDFPSLFTNILEGNAVQLDDIENEDVRYGLEKLFKCIDLVNNSDGYALPERGGRKHDVVKATIKHLITAFDNYAYCERKYNNNRSKRVDIDDKQGKQKHDKDSKRSGGRHNKHSDDDSDDDQSSSSSDSDSDDSVSSERDRHEQRGVRSKEVEVEMGDEIGSAVIGPAMPSKHELSLAQSANEQYHQQQYNFNGDSSDIRNHVGSKDDDEDDDDSFGPQMYNPALEQKRPISAVAAHQSAMLAKKMLSQPLGCLEQVIEEADQPVNKYQMRYGEYVEMTEEEATRRANAVTEREEWILDPGKNKLISEMNGIGTQNRKFQTGKVAKKTAQQISNAKEQFAEVETEESLRTKQVLAEYREQRGLTLMEQHLEKTKNNTKSGTSVAVKRKAYENDDDMMSHTKMDRFQVQKLVNDARELDSRFDKGSVQKSFL